MIMNEVKELTRREKEVAALIVKGKINKEVAKELNITESTVKGVLTRLFEKTGNQNRVELAVWYLTKKVYYASDN